MSAVTVLTVALAALLALPSGARAGAADGVACSADITPKITVNTQKNRSGRYRVPYGQEIVIHCSFKDTLHLEIEENGKLLQHVELNTTTIQFRVKKSELGQYRYSCVSNKNSCNDSLNVVVTIAMSVESSSVHHYKRNRHQYFVRLGVDYEVFCISPSGALVMEEDNKMLQTEAINRTSIKYRKRVNRVLDDNDLNYSRTSYYCQSNGTVYGDDVSEVIMVTLIADYPEAHHFSCSLNMPAAGILKCSWDYTHEFTFTLFNTDFANEQYLCIDQSGTATGMCTVTRWLATLKFDFFDLDKITFLLMSCNHLFCNNQSFAMNTTAITIPYRVFNISVLNSSSHGVALQWFSFNSRDMNVTHKVEYRNTLDDNWRQGDLSSMRCDNYGWCKSELALPYPNAKYEVRIYAKSKEARDIRFWSDAYTTLVTTEPSTEECACSEAPDVAANPTTTVSAETVLCKLCLLRKDMNNGMLALKSKIKKSLKEKLIKRKRLLQLSPVSKEFNELISSL